MQHARKETKSENRPRTTRQNCRAGSRSTY